MNDVIRGLLIALTSSFISSVVAFTLGSYRATVKLHDIFGLRLATVETTINGIAQRLERMERVQDNERER